MNIKKNNISLKQNELIINDKTAFIIKEEYKTLRTNILLSFPSDGCKIIGISSAMPNEGKSINCLNTAITFAQMDVRVLVIDCDLRIPNQARLTKLDAVPGLSNVLVGMNTVDECIRKTEFPGVDVLLSGDLPPNPSELLGSKNMKKVINELSDRYDYIFVDLPPINIVSDSLIMSQYLSGLIFVIRSAISRRDSIIEGLRRLELAKANVIGVLLTDLKGKPHYYRQNRRYGDL